MAKQNGSFVKGHIRSGGLCIWNVNGNVVWFQKDHPNGRYEQQSGGIQCTFQHEGHFREYVQLLARAMGMESQNVNVAPGYRAVEFQKPVKERKSKS